MYISNWYSIWYQIDIKLISKWIWYIKLISIWYQFDVFHCLISIWYQFVHQIWYQSSLISIWYQYVHQIPRWVTGCIYPTNRQTSPDISPKWRQYCMKLYPEKLRHPAISMQFPRPLSDGNIHAGFMRVWNSPETCLKLFLNFHRIQNSI